MLLGEFLLVKSFLQLLFAMTFKWFIYDHFNAYLVYQHCVKDLHNKLQRQYVVNLFSQPLNSQILSVTVDSFVPLVTKMK